MAGSAKIYDTVSDTALHRYIIALGSNQRHVRWGKPRQILDASIASMRLVGFEVLALSPSVSSAPVGPSQRVYANAAALVQTSLNPLAALAALHRIEADFGRTRVGQRWRSRTLDLDIVLWSGGAFSTPELTIPHPRFRERGFVLAPSVQIAAHWRDPVTGLTLRHLLARFRRPRPAKRRRCR